MRLPPLAPLLALALTAASLSPARAQEGDEPVEELLEPVAVIALAGVDRAKGDVQFLFDTVGRGEMAEVVDGYLEYANDLEGLEPTKPLGVMVFLKPGFVPIPSPVGFLPVSDLSDLRESIAKAPNVTTEMLADDLMEVKGDRGPSLFAKIKDGYALISNEREFVEERLLADPLVAAAPLAARYDFAVRAIPENIPPGMRKLFQNLLEQNTQTQMQRRDEEPEAAYRLRKSQAKRNLEVLLAMLEGSDAITLGVDASAERRTIEIELDFEAVAGTAWAEQLAAGQGRTTPFDPLHEESAPLSVVAGLTFNKWDRAATVEQLTVARDELAAALSGLRPLDDEEPARQADLDAAREAGRSDYELASPAMVSLADDVIQPLIVTAENGELDFFVQVRPLEGGGKAILGAAAVAQGDRFSQGVPRLLETLRGMVPEDNGLVRAMTLNVARENGVTWHRFDPTEQRAERRTARAERFRSNEDLDEEERERRASREESRNDGEDFFGGPPVLHVGLGRKHVWVVIGPEAALAEAQAAVEAVAADAGRVLGPSDTPLRGALNVSGWFPDAIDEDGDTLLRAREAFADGTDRVVITAEPTPTGGGRFKIVLGEGFVRFLALSITDNYDQSQL